MKIYIDGHCDTLSETLDNNEKISNTQYCFNTIDAKQLAPVIQMSAVFINPKFENGFERANNIIDYYFKNMENTVIIKNKKVFYLGIGSKFALIKIIHGLLG